MAKKLYVGNLSWGTTDETLQQLFSKYGTVISAMVISDRMTGRSKGFGFVELEKDEDAEKAMKELNESEQDGRKIIVSEARPPQPRENDGGDGGFRGGRGGSGGGRDSRGGGYRDHRN